MSTPYSASSVLHRFLCSQPNVRLTLRGLGYLGRAAVSFSRLLGGNSIESLVKMVHFLYGFFVRGAFGACSSSDCLYLTQPLMNSGQSGTAGMGSVFSGNRLQREGWCQQRSCRLLSRCLRMPRRSFLTSSINSSRVILLRSSSITFLPNTFDEITICISI